MLQQRFHRALVSLMRLERRFEPFIRPYVQPFFRPALALLIQAAINAGREDQGLNLAEEKPLPDEEAFLDSIIADMGAYMRTHYKPGEYQRAGNTKTHGIVRGEVIVHDNLPAKLRHGVFKKPRAFPAWIRFSGPGPDSPKDIDDVGFLSMSIKMMDVPGRKVMDGEKLTQDLLAICTPTFVTPDVKANAQLQSEILKGTPLFYFGNPRRSHWLDFLMQGLWNETQTSPLECQYYSTVPYLLGEGQAMQYSMRPKEKTRTPIPRLPLRPPDNYLRDAMVNALRERSAEFELLVQVQIDPHRMPIENAAVRWPTRLSPYVPVATVRIPAQHFTSAEQLAFASRLTFTPWHCLPEHRPLGNQSRARLRLYGELSKLRQKMNKTPHYEPTGKETFGDLDTGSGAPAAVPLRRAQS